MKQVLKCEGAMINSKNSNTIGAGDGCLIKYEGCLKIRECTVIIPTLVLLVRDCWLSYIAAPLTIEVYREKQNTKHVNDIGYMYVSNDIV